MSESGSEWAPPANNTPKTPDELLQARYADRENPADIDDMVVLPGEGIAQPELIEVPDWVKQGGRSEVGDPGYEAGFDDDPFAKGNEVNVKRNGKNGAPSYSEGGWKIVDDDASVKIGKDKYMVGVVVEKEIDGEVFQKSIPLNELMDLNPRETEATPEAAENEPLTEPQEELADEAISEAIGLEDPADTINGDAQKFTRDERRTMREAALRINESETLDDPKDEADPTAIPDAEKEVLAQEIEALNQELNAMLEPLSQSDKIAVWQHAGAINYKEQDYALSKLSYKFSEKNPGLLKKYEDGFKKLHDLRVKAGIFDK